jgi:hypothetical protein
VLGTGAGGSVTTGFATTSGVAFTVAVAVAVLLGVSFSFSFSLALGAAAFDLPPKTLFRIFHFPLLVSSSGKSRDSIDSAEIGRAASGSGGTGLVGDGFRWCVF